MLKCRCGNVEWKETESTCFILRDFYDAVQLEIFELNREG